VGLVYWLSNGNYKQNLPPIVIHVFGDFTLQGGEWRALERFINDGKIKFVCASDRQVKMISQFIDKPEQYVDKCPFPTDEKAFTYDPTLRLKGRKLLGVKDEFTFLYTGRLSTQKNILLMIREFARFAYTSKKKVKLFIAGEFDDIAAPFFNLNAVNGYYQSCFMHELSSLPPNIRSKIVYLGIKEQNELSMYYNACDAFLSLSLHHDEDYGMSVAEALFTGSPCLLTDWAGFNSFKLENMPVELVPTSITKSGLVVKSTDIQKAFHSTLLQTAFDRNVVSKHYKKYSGIVKCAEIILDIHNKKFAPFTGFNWKMRILERGLHFPEGPINTSIYKEVYEIYTS